MGKNRVLFNLLTNIHNTHTHTHTYLLFSKINKFLTIPNFSLIIFQQFTNNNIKYIIFSRITKKMTFASKKDFFIQKSCHIFASANKENKFALVFERVEKIFEKIAQKVCRLKKFDYLCTTNLQQSGCGL